MGLAEDAAEKFNVIGRFGWCRGSSALADFSFSVKVQGKYIQEDNSTYLAS